MKKIGKILLWVIVVFFILFIIANAAVALFGKKIVVRQIEQGVNLPVSLDSISVSLPLSAKLNKINIGGLFGADEISVSLNPLGLLAGKIVLSNLTLVNPLINLEQSSDGSLNLPKLKQEGKQHAGKKPLEIYLTSLSVKNGRLIFTDRKIDPAGFRVILGNLNANISKVMLPLTSLKTNFKVSADILSQDSRKLGEAKLSGWLDFGPKDMDASLAVKGLDLTYFSPYYGNFISNKKLLSATLNIGSKFNSKNNNLNILTDFRLSNLTYAQEEGQEGELPEINLAKNALEFFTDSAGNLNLEFEINTKMDKPDVSIKQLKQAILRAAAKNLANQSPVDLIQKVNDNIEQFKEIGKTLQNIFKGKD